jgi:hypothetical protein
VDATGVGPFGVQSANLECKIKVEKREKMRRKRKMMSEQPGNQSLAFIGS